MLDVPRWISTSRMSDGRVLLNLLNSISNKDMESSGLIRNIAKHNFAVSPKYFLHSFIV